MVSSLFIVNIVLILIGFLAFILAIFSPNKLIFLDCINNTHVNSRKYIRKKRLYLCIIGIYFIALGYLFSTTPVSISSGILLTFLFPVIFIHKTQKKLLLSITQ